MLVLRLVNGKAFSKLFSCSENEKTLMTEEGSQKKFAQKSHGRNFSDKKSRTEFESLKLVDKAAVKH